ncbi:MAG: molybdenum cofactor guanylyltransferase [Acidobacteriota bacterium]|nr:molybdenum cofactor guanylyltransferase [Acidobacteriota bacterium]
MTAAAILTGGEARRFQGRDKSRLLVGGVSILDRQLELAAGVASEVFIVTSEAREADFPPSAAARIVIDRYPGTGPLGAIVTALEATDASVLIVLGGDMPALTAPLLAAILRRAQQPPEPDVCLADAGNGIEPLAAAYRQSARDTLARALDAGQLSLRDALATLRLRVLDPAAVSAFGDPGAIFRNINSPGDL